jgi:hypothetical protein
VRLWAVCAVCGERGEEGPRSVVTRDTRTLCKEGGSGTWLCACLFCNMLLQPVSFFHKCYVCYPGEGLPKHFVPL